jgi:hypothetical protein
MSFTIVTVSTGKPSADYYTYDQFFASVRMFGHDPLVLVPDPRKKFSLGDKPKVLRKAILDKTINTKHIIFTDCYDLVFAASPEEVMEMYKYFDSPFVCSAEKNCFPGDLKDQFPESPTSYRYLNSGFIVAETEAMLTVLESMDLDNVPDDYWDNERKCNFHVNDQFLYHEAFIKQPVKMVLDHKQILSQTLHDVQLDELDIRNPLGIMNLETGKFPLTFHFNGNSKTENGTKAAILERLGL